jgi:cytochrome c biogenesis protein CcmG/thiol:disulfide interchange protein DsbE
MSRRLIVLVPLALFAAAAIAFAILLLSDRRPDSIPSVLLDRPAPPLTLPALAGSGVPGIDPATLQGQVTLVNLWASWCLPCQAEHPLLVELAGRDDLLVVGINWKDKPDAAAAFLAKLGNPFAAIGADESGRAGLDWGISGVPESFLVDRDGIVRFRWVGPLDAVTIEETLLPLAAQLNEAGP